MNSASASGAGAGFMACGAALFVALDTPAPAIVFFVVAAIFFLQAKRAGTHRDRD